MGGRADVSGARQYCITCPQSDWWAIRVLAEEAGMKTSSFILREVLGEDCRMALTGDEQPPCTTARSSLRPSATGLPAPCPAAG